MKYAIRITGIFLLLLLAACQTVGPKPDASTQTAALPPLQTATLTPAPIATATSTLAPVSTPTLLPELRVTTNDLKGAVINFWHPLSGESAGQLTRFVDQFNLTNPHGVRVNLVAPGGDGALVDALEQAKSEDLPAVILAGSAELAYWQESRGLLADLNLYLADPRVGMSSAEREGFLPIFWNQDALAGEQIGIPALRTASGLAYNRSFAADLKFSALPATPKDLMSQTCAAAKANNGYADRQGTGGWMVDTDAMTALSWMSAFGAQVVPSDAKGAWKFSQPGAVDSLRFLRDMQEKGCLWVPKNPTPQIYFGNRQALVYTATLKDLGLQTGYQKKIGSKDDWTFIPFPSTDGKGVLYAYGYSYAILRSTPKNQLAAWTFVRWMSQAENQARLGSAWISLPVSKGMRKELEQIAGQAPWTMILPLEQAARPAPSAASWRIVRRPLEDAFWQLFNLPTADLIPQILPVLDQMSADLLNKTP